MHMLSVAQYMITETEKPLSVNTNVCDACTVSIGHFQELLSALSTVGLVNSLYSVWVSIDHLGFIYSLFSEAAGFSNVDQSIPCRVLLFDVVTY